FRSRRSSRGRRARRRAGAPPDRSRLPSELDLVALDQRVGEQLLAHALQLVARLGLVRRVDLELDELPNAGLRHGKAEVPEAALDRLALWIEDSGLRPDEHCRLHPSTTLGCST